MRSEGDANILHVDLDAFYASVEQLDDPSLRGKPVIVGGIGRRGVVCAASYEARKFGVHSAMPIGRARTLCPQGVFLPTRFDRYGEKSHEVMNVLHALTPAVEQLSVDEAFVDAGGIWRRHGSGRDVALLARTQIREQTGLTASVGVATTKFLAKLASDLSKPDGLLVVEPGREIEFLAPLPVSHLWGVGPATKSKLERMGIHTIGDVAAIPEETLTGALGDAAGAHLAALARNDDPRSVIPEHAAKSIGAEETFGHDLYVRADCDRELIRLGERVAIRLRRAKLAGRTIQLKIRFGNFETRTRARTLPTQTDLSAVIVATARELLDQFDVGRGVRLLGVSISQFEASRRQRVLDLDDDSALEQEWLERQNALERAADAVRDRFGDSAVRPATLLKRPRP
jgi:DNA polymerase-4